MSPRSAFAPSLSAFVVILIVYADRTFAAPCNSWEAAAIALNKLEEDHLRGRAQWSNSSNDNLRRAAARRFADSCDEMAEEVVDLMGDFSTVVHHGAKNNNGLQRDLEKVKAKIVSFLYDIPATVGQQQCTPLQIPLEKKKESTHPGNRKIYQVYGMGYQTNVKIPQCSFLDKII